MKMDEKEGTKYNMILKRSDNQVPMSKVLQSPRPHELDWWRVYTNWVSGEMSKQAAPADYATWKRSEEQQQQEKEKYMNELESTEGTSRGFRQYSVQPRQTGYRHSYQ